MRGGVEHNNNNVRKQLQIIAEKFEYFSIALDESCDVGDTSQVLVFVRGVDSEFNIKEDLVALHSLYETTKETVCDTLRELGLPWEKLASVTTDGANAKSMVGHKTGVIGLVNSHMDVIGAK